ncbi:MAG: Ig-like domain-containing protein, partial [Bifidobacteriaceae bacterium]|nr:Ig-like domain-containing protein [Bifidobacteriaceae bacterium]
GLELADHLSAPDALAQLVAAVRSMALVQSEHTAATWAALTAALAAADQVLAEPVVDKAGAAEAATAVNAALAGLVKRADTTALAALMASARGLEAAGDVHTAESRAALLTAMATAQGLLDADIDTVSSGVVAAAAQALAAALAGLELAQDLAAPESLRGLVASVGSLRLAQADYTAASWAALQAALAGAESVLAAPVMDKAAAAAAIERIGSALNALTRRADTSELAGLAAVASGWDLTGGAYTAESAQALLAALNAAQALLDEEVDGIPASQVAAVTAALRTALAALAPAPAPGQSVGESRQLLAGMVAGAKAIGPGAYTAVSWRALTAALAAAETALGDPASSASVIEARSAALAGALSGLVKASAGGGPTGPSANAGRTAWIKAAQRSVVLAKGGKATISAGAYTAAGQRAEDKVTWKSSKPKVAKVSARGKITAKKTGKAVITVKAGSKTAKITVRVVAKAKAKVKVASVTAKAPKTLRIGATAKITGVYKPVKATAAKVKYASSNPDVVGIDKRGVATAKAKGKAVITVKAGGKSKRFTVTVG